MPPFFIDRFGNVKKILYLCGMTPEKCNNHSMRMTSSEEVYDNKWCYGEAVKTIVTYACKNCGESHVVDFLPPKVKHKSGNDKQS